MAVVTIKVGGRDYQVACDDGQEEQLRLLADDIDERLRALLFGMKGNPPGEGLGLLLTALTMADELSEQKREIERLAADCQQLRSHMGGELAAEGRIAEMEDAMAVTLEEIAARIERIAGQVETA